MTPFMESLKAILFGDLIPKVYAAVDDFGVTPTSKDFTIQSVFAIIVALTCYITRLAIIAVVIYIIWYGVNFLTAQGDPGRYNNAVKALKWGLIGTVVILGTYTIIATVANIFGADYSNFIPIDCSGV